MELGSTWDSRLANLAFAADVLNRFHWNVSVESADDQVLLRAGELPLASFDSMEELQAFATGMALALFVLPASVAEVIDQEVGE